RHNVGTRQQQVLAVRINHLDRRTDVLAGGRTILGIQYLDVGQTGQLVGLTLDGDALLHADEGHDTLHFGHDRVGVRVPFDHDRTGIDLVAFLDGNHRAIGQLVALALATKVVGNGQLAGTLHDNDVAVGTYHVLDAVQANGTAIFYHHVVDGRSPARRTTDVEGTHGQLGTRLTDGLGSNNTHCLTDVDLVTTGQIATVALGANTVTGFTGDRRTHHHFVDAVALDELDPLLVDQRASRHDDFVGTRLRHVLGNHSTQYAITQRLDDVPALDVRSQQQALLGAAIPLVHHQILCHVNQTTSQVTGVRGLQCGIRQTLTSTVGGDEVLEYVQSFTEVRGDRRFDDGAVRLGHQA